MFGLRAARDIFAELAANRSSPVVVASGLFFDSIDSGGIHTCALTRNKTAYCWGGNTFGQLGMGTFASPTLEPTKVKGGVVFESLKLSWLHTCGLGIDGQGYCWGLGDDGALGNDLLKSTSEPTLVTLPN